MRKFTKIAMIFVGTLLCIFVFNLVLYANNPGYRQALGSKVADKNYDDEYEQEVATSEISQQATTSAASDSTYEIESAEAKEVLPDTEEVSQETRAEDEPAEPEAEEKVVIDKTYHEDCGTGKGYWVITYSDGSVGLE